MSGQKRSGKEAANLVNTYFCEIGEKLANEIPKEDHHFPFTRADMVFDEIPVIGQDEVRNLVQNIDTSMSSGIPLLGSRILKECLLGIIPLLTNFLNQCVTYGKFPNSWKRALVVPIPKGTKKPSPCNICPISLLPLPGKLFEQILHKRLYFYLGANDLLAKEQWGFRNNFSTNDPIVDLVVETSRAFNKKKGMICIYIDMAKAFNSLNCTILIEKIRKLGFRDNMLDLLQDYLTSRQQVTQLGCNTSEVGSLNYGVPQGSILGPTLFNIYMNNLPLIFNTVSVKMYADDTILFKSIDLFNDVEYQLNQINEDLNLLGMWCKVNKLTINVDKSKVMLFVPPTPKYKDFDTRGLPGLFLISSKLCFVNSYRYLGIELDKHLKMELHLKNVIQKLRPVIYKFSKIRYLVDKDTAVLMYKTYVLPLVESGLFLLNNFYSGQVEKLQKIQNKCLRMCFRTDRCSPSHQLHVAAKLLPLHQRRECYLLNFLNQKLIRGDGTFSIDVGIRNSVRHGSRAKVDFPNAEFFRKSVAYEIPTLWNKLPKTYKENPVPWVFKKKIKGYHIQKLLSY